MIELFEILQIHPTNAVGPPRTFPLPVESKNLCTLILNLVVGNIAKFCTVLFLSGSIIIPMDEHDISLGCPSWISGLSL
jgi:hypothetical protein